MRLPWRNDSFDCRDALPVFDRSQHIGFGRLCRQFASHTGVYLQSSSSVALATPFPAAQEDRQRPASDAGGVSTEAHTHPNNLCHTISNITTTAIPTVAMATA